MFGEGVDLERICMSIDNLDEWKGGRLAKDFESAARIWGGNSGLKNFGRSIDDSE